MEIFARRDDGDRLVTLLEVLSLANKTPGVRGRDLYLRKQLEALYGDTNLAEIDLLRGGKHSTAVPLDLAVSKAGTFDYHVSIHRMDNLEDFFVYAVQIQDRLPEIQVPLLPSDHPVAVDLQAVFDRCYDTGPYRVRVRYQATALVPPLRPDQADWATRLLQEKGLLLSP